MAIKTQAKTTQLSTPTVQISPISSKNWTLAVPGGAFTTFPCKFRPPPFFRRPWGVHAPSAPSGYAYGGGSGGLKDGSGSNFGLPRGLCTGVDLAGILRGTHGERRRWVGAEWVGYGEGVPSSAD